MFLTAIIVEKVMKIDDAVGAVPVHFGAGIWGLLAVGIFADGTYGVSGIIDGSWNQLVLQLIDIGALIVWVAPTAFILFWVIKKTIGLRASKKEELEGLDFTEHGGNAYPDFDISHSGNMGSVAPAMVRSEAVSGKMVRKTVEQT